MILVALFTALGYKAGDKYSYRKTVFEKFYDSNLSFISKIGVINDSVSDYMATLYDSIPNAVGEYSAFLSGERFVCNDKRLTKTQKEIIETYINALGTSDSVSQKELLCSISETIKIERDKAKNEYLKFSNLSVRLGFSIGLMLVIIII